MRYLSKIFNETWMREGGYLEPELAEETVADILASKPRTLVTAAPNDTFASVIGRMKEFGISQLPVLEEGRMLGLISEVAMLNALLDGRAQATTPIAEFLGNGFAMVEAHNRVSLLSQIFQQNKIVVVEDGGRVAGIVTQIDLIEWISNRINA